MDTEAEWISQHRIIHVGVVSDTQHAKFPWHEERVCVIETTAKRKVAELLVWTLWISVGIVARIHPSLENILVTL